MKTRVGNPSKQKADQWVVRGWGGAECRVAANGRRVSFWDEEGVLEWCLYVIKWTICRRAMRFHVVCAALPALVSF